MLAKGLLIDVPMFILEKLLHFIPNQAKKSLGAPHKIEWMARLSWPEEVSNQDTHEYSDRDIYILGGKEIAKPYRCSVQDPKPTWR